MNKKLFWLVLIALIVVGGFLYLKGVGEDTWVCQGGAWVRHGNPRAPMPDTVCPGSVATSTEKTGLANPASAFCEQSGGALIIEEGGTGGQVGICYFPESKQCEEWSMYRNECPLGGVSVKGIKAPAARYCAITGGKLVGEICQLPENKQCNVDEYYAGNCPAGGTNGH
jgi:putative hemolysin